MSDEYQPRIMGFVSGSPVEQEEQQSRIKKFYDTQGYYSDKGVIYSPDWDKIENNLKSGDYIIIADLTDLSRNCEELAKRLLVPLKNSIHVVPVNEEQRKLLRWDERRDVISRLGEERALASLQMVAKQILQGTES